MKRINEDHASSRTAPTTDTITLTTASEKKTKSTSARSIEQPQSTTSIASYSVANVTDTTNQSQQQHLIFRTMAESNRASHAINISDTSTTSNSNVKSNEPVIPSEVSLPSNANHNSTSNSNGEHLHYQQHQINQQQQHVYPEYEDSYHPHLRYHPHQYNENATYRLPAQVPPEDESNTLMSSQQERQHMQHQHRSNRDVATAVHDTDDDELEEEGDEVGHHLHDDANNKYKTESYDEDVDDIGRNVNGDTHNKTTTATTTTTSNGMDHATSQDYYFDSYSHHAIHEEMLKDEVRTKTYEMAICQNKHLFCDKIVLDVGCGTGILSMFAARAGAKHIYAVDCSSIIVQAQKIIDKNGLSDKITLIRGKVEEIDLPVDTVDIIISEWMGYFLLYESMLDTVLFARDKWLVKNDGIIFPDKAVMYIAAIEDGHVRRDRFDYWDDVYGFDMSPIKEIALSEPVVDVVDPKALVTDGVPILSLDILTCTKEDLKFTTNFKLQALRNDYIHGLVAYFECAFTQIHKPIGFSTSPLARYTHWKQTILYLPETLTVCAGEVLMGELSCQPNKRNRRDLDIGLAITFTGRYSMLENKSIQYRLR